MLKYLTEHPEKGLLGYETYGLTMNVQYWRSFEDLERFANERRRPAPAGLAQLLEARGPRPAVGHLARDLPGPRRGVRGGLRQHAAPRAGRAAGLVSLKADSTARGRLKRLDALTVGHGVSRASCSSAARASPSSRWASAIRSSSPAAPKRLATVWTASTMAGSMVCSVMAPSKHGAPSRADGLRPAQPLT